MHAGMADLVTHQYRPLRQVRPDPCNTPNRFAHRKARMRSLERWIAGADWQPSSSSRSLRAALISDIGSIGSACGDGLVMKTSRTQSHRIKSIHVAAAYKLIRCCCCSSLKSEPLTASSKLCCRFPSGL